MKKVILLLLIIASILLVGCSTKNQENSKEKSNKQDVVENVKLSGYFIVTVRGLIPDYCLDDITPQVAVVTQFQDKPFTIYLGEQFVSNVEVGKKYVITIETTEIDKIIREKLEQHISPIIALEEYKAKITDIRIAKDDEGGLESNFLEFEVTE